MDLYNPMIDNKPWKMEAGKNEKILIGLSFLVGTLGLSACDTKGTMNMSNPSTIVRFDHKPSFEFYESRNINSPSLDPFRDGDIVFTLGLGRNKDRSYIVIVMPYSEKRDQSIFINSVNLSSKNLDLVADFDKKYYLDVERAGLMKVNIKAFDRLILKDIPETVKYFYVEVSYQLDGENKTIKFKVDNTSYGAPIH